MRCWYPPALTATLLSLHKGCSQLRLLGFALAIKALKFTGCLLSDVFDEIIQFSPSLGKILKYSSKDLLSIFKTTHLTIKNITCLIFYAKTITMTINAAERYSHCMGQAFHPLASRTE